MFAHTLVEQTGVLSYLPPLEEWPTCSIIIPCLNEEGYIETVVRGAIEQRYPPHLLEVIVADGGSTDGTRAIVARIAAEDPRVKLVDNPGRFPSAGMNAGILCARGKVIIRMDAHAEYAADYVLASVSALRRTGATNVGGAARARARDRFQYILSTALTSKLGFGGSSYRDSAREGFVETVFNGAFRREAFERVGLYDDRARTNEDAELNQRIIEAGGSVYLSRDIVAFYYPRSSLLAMARQYFSYGQGRARTLLRRGRLLSARPLVPFTAVTLFGLCAAIALLFPVLSVYLALSAALYVAMVCVEAARLAGLSKLRFFSYYVTIFPLMHASHGLGVWNGLVRNARLLFEGRRAVATVRGAHPTFGTGPRILERR